MNGLSTLQDSFRGCLHDTGATNVVPVRVHSGSRTGTKLSCGMKSDHILYRYHEVSIRYEMSDRVDWDG